MKHSLVFLLLAISLSAFSQTLKQNDVDEFTGQTKKTTSWEDLNGAMGGVYLRFRSIDGTLLLGLKKVYSKVVSIPEGSKLMLKFDDGVIVTIESIDTYISCRGCGAKGLFAADALGIQAEYLVNDELVEKLKTNNVEKIRIYLSDSYLEDKAKPKGALKLRQALRLVLSE